VTPGYAVTGRLRFEAIGDAFTLLKAELTNWVLASLIFIALYSALSAILNLVMFGSFNMMDRPNVKPDLTWQFISAQFLMAFAFGSISFIISAGLQKMAIEQVRGNPIDIGMVFSALRHAPALIGAYVLTQLLFMAGLVLCILPGFVLMGLLMLVTPVIVDQGVGPIRAIEVSFNALKKDWLLAWIFMIVLALIAALGMFACCVGILFTLPVLFLAIAVVYRDTVLQQPPQTGVFIPPPPPGA
jgi:hypothetical protein